MWGGLSIDLTARIWNLDGTQLEVLTLPKGQLLYHTDWSPDGQRIITCSSDGTAKIWRSVDWARMTEAAETTKDFEKQLATIR